MLNFWRDFLTDGGQERYFLVSIWVSVCRNRTCKNFENGSILNRDFALGGEIIHDHKFSFYAILLT